MAATVVVFSFLRDGDQVCKSEQGGECAQRGGTILSALSLMYIAAAVSFFSSASSAITANSANGQLTAGGRHSGVASLAHGAAVARDSSYETAEDKTSMIPVSLSGYRAVSLQTSEMLFTEQISTARS